MCIKLKERQTQTDRPTDRQNHLFVQIDSFFTYINNNRNRRSGDCH